jgi:hypothetical protein
MSLINEDDFDAGFKKIYLRGQLRTTINESGEEKKDLESIMHKQWTEEDFNYNSKINKDLGFGHIVRCGPENGITVVDYDDDELYKRDVAEFFKDSCQEFYTVKTRRGWHVYFEYDPDIKEYNPKFTADRGGRKRIDTLTTLTKCVFGIGTHGIRKNGEDFDYNYMWGTVRKMPDNFKARFILKNPDADKIKEYTSTIDYEFKIDDEELREILRLLNESYPEYFNDYDKWLTFTTIMKTLGQKELWNELSKEYDTQKKYNKRKNESVWRSSSAKISINYFTKMLKLPRIVFHKADEDFYCDVAEFEDQYNEMNTKYINMMDDVSEDLEEMPTVGSGTSDHFKDNQVIFLDAGTGTGKSSCFFQKFKAYTENNKQYTALSIVNLRSLALQQTSTAKSHGVVLRSYREKKMCKSLMMLENTVICLNSIYRLANSNFSKKILFIDEIHSLLKSLTECNHITNKYLIYSILKRMIKDCHKVIVSDAHIFKHVMSLLEERLNDGKTNFIYFKNTFNKYKGVNAYKFDGEQDFFGRLRYMISKNIYFVFASDNKAIITERFHQFCEEVDEKTRKKMLLWTADETPDEEAQEDTLPDWNNKFIFYSPTITHGVSIETVKPIEQFIYISGLSVDAISLYQMATRTRNMKQLNYYSKAKGTEARFKDLSDCQLKMAEEYLTNIKQLSLLPEESYKLIQTMINDKETKVNNDTFKTLYDFNVYLKDYYGTNPTYYFEKEIKRVGFKISVRGDSKRVTQEDIEEEKDEMQEITESRRNDRYAELKRVALDRRRVGKGIMDSDDEDEDEDAVEIPKAVENMLKRVEILKLGTNEQLDTYREVVEDEFMFENFMSFTRLLKDKSFADSKIVEVMKNKMIAGLHCNHWVKIMYLHKMATVLNIHNNIFGLENIVEPAEAVLKSEEVQTIIKNVKQLYKKRDTTPTDEYTGQHLVKLYKFLLSTEVGLLKLVESKQSKKKATRDKTTYSIVQDSFKKYKDLVDIMRADVISVKRFGEFNPLIITNVAKGQVKTDYVVECDENDIEDFIDELDF